MGRSQDGDLPLGLTGDATRLECRLFYPFWQLFNFGVLEKGGESISAVKLKILHHIDQVKIVDEKAGLEVVAGQKLLQIVKRDIVEEGGCRQFAAILVVLPKH